MIKLKYFGRTKVMGKESIFNVITRHMCAFTYIYFFIYNFTKTKQKKLNNRCNKLLCTVKMTDTNCTKSNGYVLRKNESRKNKITSGVMSANNSKEHIALTIGLPLPR